MSLLRMDIILCAMDVDTTEKRQDAEMPIL